MNPARATGLVIGEDESTVCLADGRRGTVPYHCYARLENANRIQRSHFEVYVGGKMLSWPEIDEDEKRPLPSFFPPEGRPPCRPSVRNRPKEETLPPASRARRLP